jgi:hypothetical protein
MAASDGRGQEEDGIKRFDPRILDRSVIAIPLLEKINQDENEIHAVIIDVNLDYPRSCLGHQPRDGVAIRFDDMQTGCVRRLICA